MKQEITLLIMAAGLGSRFGSLKQIEPIGPNNEILIEYSLYDAIKSGFNKIIFVIKEENLEMFKEKIGNRLSKKIKVEYVFQKQIITNREKPLGTGYAVLSSMKKIQGPFGVINADDYYGYESFKELYNFLSNSKNEHEYCVISYDVKNTISENGTVKRGICEINEEIVTYINDYEIYIENEEIYARSFDGEENKKLNVNQRCCMNMFGFKSSIFQYLEKQFELFLLKKDINNAEFMLPVEVSKLINTNKIKVVNINTIETWYGMTYSRDKQNLVDAIKKYTEEGKY